MYKKILVPIALDQGPNTASALEVAQKLKADDGEIVAVHAIEPIPSYAAHNIPAELMQSGRDEALAALISELGDVQGVKAELIDGSAGRAITDYADNHDVDCIVVASHQPGLQD